MIKIGTWVRVIEPDYASGSIGRIQAQEASGRWLVKIEDSFFPDREKPMLLSLEEGDFEVIDHFEE